MTSLAPSNTTPDFISKAKDATPQKELVALAIPNPLREIDSCEQRPMTNLDVQQNFPSSTLVLFSSIANETNILPIPIQLNSDNHLSTSQLPNMQSVADMVNQSSFSGMVDEAILVAVDNVIEGMANRVMLEENECESDSFITKKLQQHLVDNINPLKAIQESMEALCHRLDGLRKTDEWQPVIN